MLINRLRRQLREATETWARASDAMLATLDKPQVETAEARKARETAEAEQRHADWLASIPRRPTLPQDKRAGVSTQDGAPIVAGAQDSAHEGGLSAAGAAARSGRFRGGVYGIQTPG